MKQYGLEKNQMMTVTTNYIIPPPKSKTLS